MSDNSNIGLAFGVDANVHNSFGQGQPLLLQKDFAGLSSQQLLNLAGEGIIQAWQNKTDPTQALFYAFAGIFGTNFEANAQIAFGEKFDIQKAKALGNDILSSNYGILPDFQFTHSSEFNGAYAESLNTVYMNSVFVSQNAANPNVVGKVLVEELGHRIDIFSSPVDSMGDEGKILAKLVNGEKISSAELTSLKTEDDHKVINIDSQQFVVEMDAVSGTANTLQTAKNIGVLGSTSQTFTGFVGDSGIHNYIKFQVTTSSVFAVELSGLTKDANVRLLNDQGGFIQASYNKGTVIDAFQYQLDVGTYYINVYREAAGDNTNYSLRVSVIPDNAGNSLATAKNLGNLGSVEQVFSDFVGSGDTSDYYQFALTAPSQLSVKLDGLTGDANLQLLNSWGSVLQYSYNSGTTAESINTILAAGTYYVNVNPNGAVNANYTLRLQAPAIIDNAGNNLASARNIGTLGATEKVFNDLVGSVDSADYYKFNVTSASTVTLNLAGLSGNANLQLLNSTGGAIAGSYNGGNSADTISTTLAAGDYYAYVYSADSVNTNYSLSVSAIPDNAGNSLATAKNLGNLGSVEQIFSDFVGNGDTSDYYQFTLTAPSQLNVSVDGLSGDANLQLLNSWGSGLQYSNNSGTIAESINTILAAGTYYLNVYPNGSINTNYTLKLKASAIVDNAGDTLATAKNIGIIGTTLKSFTDLVGDVDIADYYKFTLAASSTVTLNMTGLSTDANVQILNSIGSALTGSYNGGTTPETISTTLAAGDYYAYVYRAGSGNTNYGLSFVAVPDNAGNSLATAKNLGNLGSVEQVFSDFVGSGDTSDYYQFTLTAPSQLNVSVDGLSGDANLQLLNSWGSVLQYSYNTGTISESINTILAAGTYYLNVYPNGSINTNYTLKLKASAIVDNAGDTLATAKNLGIIGTTPKSFTDLVGDVDTADYYKFTLAGASTVTLNMTGLSTDANVQILNSSGSALTGSYNGGITPETISTTLAAGDYYAYVYRAGSGNTNYGLSFVAVPDNAGNSLAAAKSLGNLGSVEQVFSDFVGSGDTSDYYQFILTAPSQLSIKLDGLTGDANLQLLNSWGSVLQYSYNSGTIAESINTILAAGTYYVNVYPNGSINTNYTLRLQAPAIIDNAGNSLATARNIGTLGTTEKVFNDLVGSVDSTDYYKFNVTSASTVTLNLAGMSGNANLQLFNSTGGAIAGSYNWGNSTDTISITLAAGDYYAYVYSADSVNTNYSLSVSAIPDNAGNSLATAKNLGNLASVEQIFSDFVGDADVYDYYQFSLSTLSNVNFVLDALNANANLQLLNSSGGVIQASYNLGTAADKINYNLNAGTYYLNVYRETAGTSTTYKLGVSVIPDYAGSTIATARTISLAPTVNTFSDFVGDVDNSDFYKFDVTIYSKVSFQLDGLSGNANLQLLDSTGKLIQTSNNTGVTADKITYDLDEGTYFVNVYREAAGDNTKYNLGVSATYLPMPDRAGNTQGAARNIGTLTTTQTFKDLVGVNDKEDWYSFYIAEPGTANIAVTSNKGANVEFYRGNTMLSRSSTASNLTRSEYISEPGQYYVRIGQNLLDQDSNYSISLSTTSSVVDLGSLSGTRNVVASNNIAYYRFKLTQNSVVTASTNFPNAVSLDVRDSSYSKNVGS